MLPSYHPRHSLLSDSRARSFLIPANPHKNINYNAPKNICALLKHCIFWLLPYIVSHFIPCHILRPLHNVGPHQPCLGPHRRATGTAEIDQLPWTEFQCKIEGWELEGLRVLVSTQGLKTFLNCSRHGSGGRRQELMVQGRLRVYRFQAALDVLGF